MRARNRTGPALRRQLRFFGPILACVAAAAPLQLKLAVRCRSAADLSKTLRNRSLARLQCPRHQCGSHWRELLAAVLLLCFVALLSHRPSGRNGNFS